MSVDTAACAGGASSGSAADSVPSSPAQEPAQAPVAAPVAAPAVPMAPGSQLAPATLQALLLYLGNLAHAAGRAWGAQLPQQV